MKARLKPMPSPPRPPDLQGSETPGEIDPRLLEVLVCPLTHTALDYDRAAGELISRAARLAYPIRGGVPVMLPEEARALDAPEG
jgi:uncharacterized protein YbaR (Trm112 family)